MHLRATLCQHPERRERVCAPFCFFLNPYNLRRTIRNVLSDAAKDHFMKFWVTAAMFLFDTINSLPHCGLISSDWPNGITPLFSAFFLFFFFSSSFVFIIKHFVRIFNNFVHVYCGHPPFFSQTRHIMKNHHNTLPTY